MTSLNKNHPRQKFLFTLIELLVVIAIISILMTILLPALSKARRRTKIIACLNNEKQVGTSIFSYANDMEGNLPSLTVHNLNALSTSATKQNLGQAIPDYITMSSANQLYCTAPASDFKYQYDSNPNDSYNFVDQFYTGTNTFAGYGYRGGPVRPADMADFPKKGFNLAKDIPGKAVLADYFGSSAGVFSLSHASDGTGSFKGLNVLYLDGHAQWINMTYSQLVQLAPSYSNSSPNTENMWLFLDNQ